MRGVWTIALRELRSSFERPLALGLLGLFVSAFALLTLGVDDVLTAGVASLRSPLGWAWLCLLLLAPAVTARTFVDEWRGTWPLLGALPLHPAQIVVGKWLGAVALLAAALALTAPWPVALLVLGEPDLGPILTGYGGLLLGAGALAAAGIAASAWTESAPMAFLLGFLAGAAPTLAAAALPVVPQALVPLVEALSVPTQLQTLSRGIVDTRSLLLFAVVTVAALRLAIHAVEARRLS